ncbi:MAG: class II fructose-bisphosphate aldolase [Mobiluncus porci]|uniref:Class II fructose-bisphosphate aldolase n=1 Tax=Mobiluncus porci TaxID=2652278 RepID=A0A7K0JZZ4_9ACTO|nr:MULTISPECIES: class II fructose-bisphosphate aldolase [Mobiluncus]MCI6584612.1 class II fructose-bisphosphate aldolase [Mobiluncus sp.]MDD7541547.1 class II fructose-bisphosphate aldolase [Mobiluncus porci]MDY5748532.1 class II fructose-bisphosphate aldolase [Mobiluncus porci]MST48708.1 class II fructose-bisphosphate aldolase [Mobiluncus porci]
MLADIRELARDAASHEVGLGAFNVVLLEHGEAQIAAAEAVELPIILQLSQNAVKYHRGWLEPIGSAVLELAKRAKVPAVAHLDHAEDIDLCKAAVELGFNSIMYDGSKLPDEENRKTTAEITKWCHDRGVSVEAELGEVGGKNGVHDPSARTKPEDAAKFVEDTGVDLLAVAVGSSHAMTSRDASLDNELIAAIKAAVPVPLVLHGSSGVSDEGMRAAIQAGMTKINVSTHLNVIYTAKVREDLAAGPDLVDPRKYSSNGNAALQAEVERLLNWYAGK